MQPDVGHDSLPTGFHHDAPGAVSVYFGDALLVRDSAVLATTVSPTGRAFPRTRGDQLKWRREEAGPAEPLFGRRRWTLRVVL